MGDRQPQSGSLADFLGREERIEDPFEMFLFDALAIVLDQDQHARAHELGAHGDTPLLVFDGLRGVVEQIQQYLVDLRRRAWDFGQFAILENHFDIALAHDVLDDAQRTRDQLVEVRLLQKTLIQSTEVLQVVDQFGDLTEPVQGIVEQLADIDQRRLIDPSTQFGGLSQAIGQVGRRLYALFEEAAVDSLIGTQQPARIAKRIARHLDVVAHVAQRRVDLVDQARHHLAERRHFFRLHELQLGRLQPRVGTLELAAALGETRVHCAKHIENDPRTEIAASAVDQDEVIGDRALNALGDQARSLIDWRIDREDQRIAIGQRLDRPMSVQLPAEAHQEDTHHFVAAYGADRLVASHDRQREEPCVAGIQHAVGDAVHRRQRIQCLRVAQERGETLGRPGRGGARRLASDGNDGGHVEKGSGFGRGRGASGARQPSRSSLPTIDEIRVTGAVTLAGPGPAARHLLVRCSIPAISACQTGSARALSNVGQTAGRQRNRWRFPVVPARTDLGSL